MPKKKEEETEEIEGERVTSGDCMYVFLVWLKEVHFLIETVYRPVGLGRGGRLRRRRRGRIEEVREGEGEGENEKEEEEEEEEYNWI